jgi:hypothetical protein
MTELLKIKALRKDHASYSGINPVKGYYFNKYAFPDGELTHFVTDCLIIPTFTHKDKPIQQTPIVFDTICRATSFKDRSGERIFEHDEVLLYGKYRYKFMIDCAADVYFRERTGDFWVRFEDDKGRVYNMSLYLACTHLSVYLSGKNYKFIDYIKSMGKYDNSTKERNRKLNKTV